MAVTLRQLIDDDRVHIVDGAMGTMLYSRGVFVNVCYDDISRKHPDLVEEVHKSYIDAGAEIIETNTFGANPAKLSAYGLADETRELNRYSAELARRAAGDSASVVGAVGPLGVRIEPFGPTSLGEAQDLFGEQVAGLIEGGVDGFSLETFSDISEIQQAIRAVREATDLPIIAQMTVGDDGLTAYGDGPALIAEKLNQSGADVIGLNCSVGPSGLLQVIEQFAKHAELPVSAQPNAGYPKEVGDRKIYLASPEYVATYAKRIIEAGARFIGGCCGTTPEHIREIRNFVASVQPRHKVTYVHHTEVAAASELDPPPLGERSNWGQKLAAGEMVTSVEIVPPRGADATPMLEQCRKLKEAGIDAVNVPDGPRAQSRMGVLPSAILIQREVGIEPVIHYCCRDRNLLGMLSDLLGASAAGLRNLLLITGDPPKMGPYPESTAVFDIDAIGLTNLAYKLNHGQDPGGHNFGSTTDFVIGVGVNPAAVDMEREMSRYRVEGGSGSRVRNHSTGVRPGTTGVISGSFEGASNTNRGRHLAAGISSQR